MGVYLRNITSPALIPGTAGELKRSLPRILDPLCVCGGGGAGVTND